MKTSDLFTLGLVGAVLYLLYQKSKALPTSSTGGAVISPGTFVGPAVPSDYEPVSITGGAVIPPGTFVGPAVPADLASGGGA